MSNFKKLFNSKIFSLVIALVFILNTSAYGIDPPKKTHLRTPILGNTEDGKARLKEGLATVLDASGEDRALQDNILAMLGEYLAIEGEGTSRNFVSEEKNDAIIREMKEMGEIAIKGLSNILVDEERAWMRAKIVLVLRELYSKENDGILEILFKQLSHDESVLVRSIIARYILPEIKKGVSGARVKQIDSFIKKADLDPWPADKNRALKILDIGSFYGEVSHGIAGYYKDKGFIDVVVVGVDLVFVTLIEAEKNRIDDDIVFVYGNIDDDRFGPADVVLSKNLYPLDPENTKQHAESLIRQLEDKDGNIHGDGAEIYFSPSAFSPGTDGSAVWAAMGGALEFLPRIKSEGLDSKWHSETSFENPFGFKGIEPVFGSPWPNSYGWVTATLSPDIMVESDKGLVKLRTDRFPDGEIYLRILNSDMVKDGDLSVNCSIESPDDLVRIVLLMDMLRYYGAKTIQLVLDDSPHITNGLDELLLYFCDGVSVRYQEEGVVGTRTRKLDSKPLRPIKDKKSTVWIDPVLYQHKRLRGDALNAGIAVNAKSWRIEIDEKSDNPLSWEVSFKGRVTGRNVALVHSMENSTDIAELWVILMALKRAGASSVSLISSYEGYSRQDKVFNKGEGISALTMLKILDTLVDNHMALNVHYADKSGMVQMGGYELYNLNAFVQVAEGLFDITKEWLIKPRGAKGEEEIKNALREEFKNHPIILLAPDDGAFGYVQEAAKVLKIYIKDRYGLEIDVHTGYMDKERVSGTQVKIPGRILDENGKAINEINGVGVNECWPYILDDETSHGSTLLSSTFALVRKMGFSWSRVLSGIVHGKLARGLTPFETGWTEEEIKAAFLKGEKIEPKVKDEEKELMPPRLIVSTKSVSLPGDFPEAQSISISPMISYAVKRIVGYGSEITNLDGSRRNRKDLDSQI